MDLQPGEFIAICGNSLLRVSAYNMVSGTVVRLGDLVFVLVAVSGGFRGWVAARTGCCLSHERFAARVRKDCDNLPVVLFDPLGADMDKENNDDND